MNTTKTAPRAAVYLRQSQDRNDDQLAISRQREDCLALCRAKGWTPIQPLYEDNDCSAFNGKLRPQYQRLLADIAAGKIDAVVAWHQDRLHRDVMELLQFGDVARRHDLKLATVSGDIDLSTDDGEFMATMGAAIARKEVRRKSERQKRAAEQRAQQGTQWWSVRPFGFAYHDGRPMLDAHGAPTLDPIEAAEIRAAYTAIQAGQSVYAITADLNARGVVTPRGNRWRPSQTRQLLLSPRNAGLRTFRKQVVGEGNWPAIVAEDLWRAVAYKLSDPDRRCGQSRARKYLLSGIAACGLCGSPMGSGVTKKPRQNSIYTCKSCNKVSRNAAHLDAAVIEAVVARLSRDDATDLIVDIGRPDLEALIGQRQALRDQQAALGVKLANGQVSLAMAQAADRRFTEQIEALTKQITAPDRAEIFGDVIGSDADRKFAPLGLDRQRTVIDTLLDITVHPTGRGRRFDPASIDIAYR